MNGYTLAGGMLLVAATMAGQPPEPDWSYRFEVFGALGQGRLYHGDDLLSKGRQFSGGVGVRPFSGGLRSLGFDVRAGGLNRRESTPVYPVLDLDATLVTADVLYHFMGRSRAQPYVLGGIAFVRAEYYRKCVACVFQIDAVSGALVPLVVETRWDASKRGVVVGGGLKVARHRHLWLRSDLVLADTTPGRGANLGWVLLQIAAGLHF